MRRIARLPIVLPFVGVWADQTSVRRVWSALRDDYVPHPRAIQLWSPVKGRSRLLVFAVGGVASALEVA